MYIQIQRIAQVLITIFNVWIQRTCQFEGTNPGTVHFRQHGPIKGSVMRDIILAALITPNGDGDTRLALNHLLGDVVNGHGVQADRPVWADQVAHRISDFPVDHVNGSDFHYAAV
ncbi:hypothetical protein D3C76_1514840 [compost metagenome]